MTGKFDTIFSSTGSAETPVKKEKFDAIFANIPNIDYSKSGYDPTGLLTDYAKSRLKEPIPAPQSATDIFKEDMLGTFGGTVKTLADLQSDPLSTKGVELNAPGKSFARAGSAAIETLTAAGDEESKRAAEFIKNPDLGNTLKVIAGGANVLFSPISALFAGAEKIPVLGSLSKLISLPFSVLGEGGAKATDNFINVLPIDQKTKDKIRQGADEIGALATQLLGGKAGIDMVKKISLVKSFGAKDAKVIIEIATEKAKMTQQTMPGKFDNVFTQKQPEIATKENGGVQPEIPPIPGTGEIKTRGVSLSVEEAAVENRLVQSLGDLPEYQTVNMKEQAKMASDILSQDYERAKRIAMGQEPAPQGVIPESLFLAIEEKATRDGDVNMIRELSVSSKLTSAGTTMGQRIRMYGERDENSPVGAIQDIVRTREKAIENMNLKKTNIAKTIKESINKVKIPKETWDSFVENLKC